MSDNGIKTFLIGCDGTEKRRIWFLISMGYSLTSVFLAVLIHF